MPTIVTLSRSTIRVLRRAANWRTGSSSTAVTTNVGATASTGGTSIIGQFCHPTEYRRPTEIPIPITKNGGSSCRSSRTKSIGVPPPNSYRTIKFAWHSTIPTVRLNAERQPAKSYAHRDQEQFAGPAHRQKRYYHTTPHRPILPLILGGVAVVGGYVLYRKLVLGESVVPEQATRAKEAYQKLHGRQQQDSSSTSTSTTQSIKASDVHTTAGNSIAKDELNGAKKSPRSQEQSKDQ